MLRVREDARIAVEELRREPAAAIFARAHAGKRASEDEALFRTVLLGLLDLDGRELRRLRLGGRGVRARVRRPRVRRSSVSVGGTLRSRPWSASRSRRPSSSRPTLALRPFVTGELATHWPESRGLLPRTSAASPTDRSSSSSAASSMPAEQPPDAAGGDRRRGQRASTDDQRGGRGRAGPLRDSRRPPVRHPAGAPDRSHSASGRVVTPRCVPRADRGRRPVGTRRRRRRPRSRGRARSLGAGALPGRTVPRRAAQERALLPARGDVADALLRLARGRSACARGALRRGHIARGRRRCDERSRRCGPACCRGCPPCARPRRSRARARSRAARGRAQGCRARDRRLKHIRRETVTRLRSSRGYRRGVDESRAVLERLQRIEALDRAGAAPSELVAELRALVAEAEAWAHREGGESGRRAAAGLRRALSHDMIEQ